MIVVDRRIITNPAEDETLRRVSSVADDEVAESAEEPVETEATEEPEAIQKKRGRKRKEGV